MDPITRQAIAAAGAGGSDPLYVDDVFSTFLYNGTGSAQTITNGIDLSGEGGLVWAKVRNSTIHHHLVDTERGGSKYLKSNQTSVEGTDATMITSFNSDGYSIGSSVYFSQSPRPYVNWTFRKAPGFFDVVTYTGNGTSGRTVSHNLGSVPGMIIVKNLHDTGYSWAVWHRSLGSNGYLFLNSDNQENSNSNYFPSQPTASNFAVGSSGLVNIDGDSYVAYIFAHDDQSFGTDSDEAIIKCGSFSSDSSGAFNVNLGWEPQLVLIKTTSATGDWYLLDTIRGLAKTHVSTLRPNTTGGDINYIAEGYCYAHASGFASDTNFFGASRTFAYMAIRRPHKPPEAGTDVFAVDNQGTGTMPPQYHSNFVVDWAFNVAFNESQAYRYRLNFTRLLGGTALKINETSAEINFSSARWDYMDGFYNNNSSVSTTYAWMFKRAPGVFDAVSYTGTGSARTVDHNLGVAPEFMIVRARNISENWPTYNSTDGATKGMFLNSSNDPFTFNFWNSTAPTATQFTVATDNAVNGNTKTYIAYLFATLDGISKVGSYSGTGNAINVDCGFTNGARFVLIKRTDANGDWYVWDSTRGIVSGNDPYFLLNTDGTDVTNTDYIDPLNAGFTVTSSAPAALNTSGGTYLFLAIA